MVTIYIHIIRRGGRGGTISASCSVRAAIISSSSPVSAEMRKEYDFPVVEKMVRWCRGGGLLGCGAKMGHKYLSPRDSTFPLRIL